MKEGAPCILFFTPPKACTMWINGAGNRTPERAFELFFARYFATFCNFAWRWVRDMEVSRDLVMDCFARVWEKKEKLPTEEELRAYLYVSIRNACLRFSENQSRRDRKLAEMRSSLSPEEKDISQDIIRTETFHQLRLAVDALPPQCRRIFLKLYVEEKTVKETAAELRLSISTVNNQKARGLKLLRGRLDGKIFLPFLEILIILSIFSIDRVLILSLLS